MGDEQLLEIENEQREIRNFKSVYYQMNSKADSITRIFGNNVIVDLDAIKNLNNMVVNKLKNYRSAGFTINVTTKFKDKKSKFFNSWQSFESHQWTEGKPLNKLTIKWEAYVILPGIEIPQKHTLIVKISDSMRPEEILNIVFSGGLEEIEEIDKDVFPVVASVDYIDDCLGEELLDIVAKWDDGLREELSQGEKIIQKAKKHKTKIADIINYVPSIIMIICSYLILKSKVIKLPYGTIGEITTAEFINILTLAVVLVMLCIIFKKMFHEFARALYSNLNDYGEYHIFNITNGDKKEQDKVEKRNSRKKGSVIANIIISCFLNIACGIITNILIG